MQLPVQPSEERITLRSIAGYLLETVNLQRGLGYTIKRLIVDPRGAMEDFLFRDRRRMVKPFSLLLLAVGLTSLLSFHYFDLPALLDAGIQKDWEQTGLPAAWIPKVRVFISYFQQYFNLVLMSSLPFMALASYLVFRSGGLNYAEHLVVVVYLYSIQSLIIAPFMPLLADPQAKIFALLAIPLTAGYQVYAFTRIFEQKWMEGIIKTAIVYLFSQVLNSVMFTLAFLIIVFLT